MRIRLTLVKEPTDGHWVLSCEKGKTPWMVCYIYVEYKQ